MSSRTALLTSALILFSAVQSSHSEGLRSPEGLHSNDLYRFRAVADVEFSPDGKYLAYVVNSYSGPGSPTSQIWIMNLATRQAIHLGSDKESTSHPRWSPDSNWIAYMGGIDDKRGLTVAHADGASVTFLAKVTGTNSPLPGQGESVAWSPDSKRIAFVSAVPGPETKDGTGDPVVITRYLYKPTASEGLTHFNDNRRLHLFA